VYVANSASNDVTVIDPVLDTVIATIPVGDMPRALAVDSFNGKVYCVNEQSDNVSVIDCSTNTVVATFPAHYTPMAVLTTLYGRTYVANTNGSSVTVIADSAAVGIAESFKPQAPSLKPQATVVRGVLRTGVVSSQHSAYWAELVDAVGRRVMALKAGANDVSGLSPGVYFLREQSVVSSQHSGTSAVGGRRLAVSVRKVIITR